MIGIWLAGAVLYLSAPYADDAERLLTGKETTEHFEIRYRPGSRAGAAVDYVAFRVEQELDHATARLGIDPEGPFQLWLYDDVAELAKITHTEGAGGFAVENQVHMPWDNDQTRFHELVHVLALHIPDAGGDEERNLFFAEGLSNAVLEYVTGVHVHAVAAFERKRGALPPLAEMTTGDFYAWIGRNPNLGHYDIAGSWMLFLLDEYGAKKVGRYYTGTPAKKAFGKSLEKLEKAWHERLDELPLRPEVETLLKRRRGMTAEFSVFEMDPDERLPAELVGEPGDWMLLEEEEMAPELEGEWERVEGGFRGSHPQDADWSVCDLGAEEYGDCIVRATIEPEEDCVGVQLRFGSRCQAMLTNAGTFVYAEGVVAASGDDRITGRRSLDMLVERRGDTITIYLDGFRIVEGRASDAPHALGLGVAGGSATFTEVRIRDLP